MSVESSGSVSQQQTPQLFLTPTPPVQSTQSPLNAQTQSSSIGPSRSVSPRMMSVGSDQTSPDVPPTPTQQSNQGSAFPANQCRFCLYVFSDNYNANRHMNEERCVFRYRPERDIDSQYQILRRPENHIQTLAILQQLPQTDRVRMCQLNSWAIPGVWPIVFPGHFRQGGETSPILREMTASNDSTQILRDLLRNENQVHLPKQIILIDAARNIKSVLPTRVLTPGSEFVTTVSGDSITVSLGRKSVIHIIHVNYFCFFS